MAGLTSIPTMSAPLSIAKCSQRPIPQPASSTRRPFQRTGSGPSKYQSKIPRCTSSSSGNRCHSSPKARRVRLETPAAAPGDNRGTPATTRALGPHAQASTPSPSSRKPSRQSGHRSCSANPSHALSDPARRGRRSRDPLPPRTRNRGPRHPRGRLSRRCRVAVARTNSPAAAAAARRRCLSTIPTPMKTKKNIVTCVRWR